MNKYLLANIVNDKIILCALLKEEEMKDGIQQFLDIAHEFRVLVDEFYKSWMSGNSIKLSNGTTLQFMIVNV